MNAPQNSKKNARPSLDGISKRKALDAEARAANRQEADHLLWCRKFADVRSRGASPRAAAKAAYAYLAHYREAVALRGDGGDPAAEERAAVVAWLRDQAAQARATYDVRADEVGLTALRVSQTCVRTADAIERGEHRA